MYRGKNRLVVRISAELIKGREQKQQQQQKLGGYKKELVSNY